MRLERLIILVTLAAYVIGAACVGVAWALHSPPLARVGVAFVIGGAVVWCVPVLAAIVLVGVDRIAARRR